MWTALTLPVILAFAQRWVSTFCSLVLPIIDVLVVDKPLKFHFCDPSRGRRKRRMAALRLDGFIHHSFNSPVESGHNPLFSTNFNNVGISFVRC